MAELAIEQIIDLSEKHNTMGQFVQQKLHELQLGKISVLDQTSKTRIYDWVQECVGMKIPGAEELLQKITDTPVSE